MTVKNLESLFHPRSIAVLGASNRPRSVGNVVMRNLLQGGFEGPIMPVNPGQSAIAGVRAYAGIASLPETPELGVICTPAATVPGLIAELGARGAKAAVVLSAGLREQGDGDRNLQQQMLEAAQPHCLRILGPNCIGAIVPGAGLNASFAHTGALPGKLAFVSQSGALCTAVLDWARSANIGFSHFISTGDSADVDFGDLLDYLGNDPKTQGILLYMESISHARKFMSAARATARNKPVLAIKAGRMSEGAAAAASHTGALAGSDEVVDAALRRAGILRVDSIDELFYAVETLARARPVPGDRLAIVTNGGGPGVMATDSLIRGGGRLAELAPETLAALDQVLPATWSRGNPVDIIGDADAERYAQALEIVLRDPQADAVLVMHVPTAIVSSEEVARAVAEKARASIRPVLTNWMGADAVRSSRQIFAEAGLPSYETPYSAVKAFLHRLNYQRNQEMLIQTPPSLPEEFEAEPERARRIIATALDEGREWLTEPEAKEVLNCYGIPVVATRVARDADGAVRAAGATGYPVALKVLSPDITHKSDVGGVVLDLENAEDLHRAAQEMEQRIRRNDPAARITGFTVQAMTRWPGAFELILGMSTDPVFGPAMLFGHGGTAVEIIGDRAVALPPLNLALARDLIARTHIYRQLQGYRNTPAADLEAIGLALVKLSQLVTDLAEVAEVDINPLLASSEGVIALDARLRVQRSERTGADRLAIHPYPSELEEWVSLASGQRVLLRPIRPEDEPQHEALFKHLEPHDVYLRFFRAVNRLSHAQMARLTQIDYDREMAFIATARDEAGEPETLGVVRAISDPDRTQAEFAIIIRSDFKRRRLGHLLLDKLVRYCEAKGIGRLVGTVLNENTAMLKLADDFGFTMVPRPADGTVEISYPLQPQAGQTASPPAGADAGGPDPS